MTGHIKLGLTEATLHEYMLDDVRRRRRQLANPMAVRLGTGGEFSDYENWALHVAADWREGVGKLAEDAAGYLFGEIESRVPEQLIMPSALGCTWIHYEQDVYTPYLDPDEVCSFFPAEATQYTEQVIGGSGNPGRISIGITIASETNTGLQPHPDVRQVSFYGTVPDGVEVTAALYSDNSGVPDSSLASGVLSPTNYRPGHNWYTVTLSTAYTTRHAQNAPFHWVIYPTNSNNQITIVQGDGYGENSYLYSNAAWSINSGVSPFFLWGKPLSIYFQPGPG